MRNIKSKVQMILALRSLLVISGCKYLSLKVSINTEVVFSSLYPMAYLLKRVSKRAAAAINVFSGIFFLFENKAFYSPISLKNSKSWKVEVNSNWVWVTSTVGRLNLPEREKIFPISVNERRGDTIGLTPPSLSDSARFKHIRNSYSVSPPKADPINTPSGIKVSR